MRSQKVDNEIRKSFVLRERLFGLFLFVVVILGSFLATWAYLQATKECSDQYRVIDRRGNIRCLDQEDSIEFIRRNRRI